MIYETIKLRPEYEATLTAYVFEELTDIAPHTRPSIVVCPGGGYRFLSDREAEPIVSAYLGAGFNVFLLRYTVLEGAADYAPLIQAATAIAYVRENAERYGGNHQNRVWSEYQGQYSTYKRRDLSCKQ